MGVLYWRGEGVDQDRVKAGTWFGAAASGSEDAETNLGWFYLDDSQGVYSATSDEEAALLDRYAGSREKAFQWFCKAATQGDARAQFKVGEAYWNGSGAGMNKLQARLWLEKAAQQDADAIAWLESAANAAWYTRLKTGFTLRWMESCPASPTAPVPPIAGTPAEAWRAPRLNRRRWKPVRRMRNRRLKRRASEARRLDCQPDSSARRLRVGRGALSVEEDPAGHRSAFLVQGCSGISFPRPGASAPAWRRPMRRCRPAVAVRRSRAGAASPGAPGSRCS